MSLPSASVAWLPDENERTRKEDEDDREFGLAA
jgi:hypothetical protein